MDKDIHKHFMQKSTQVMKKHKETSPASPPGDARQCHLSPMRPASGTGGGGTPCRGSSAHRGGAQTAMGFARDEGYWLRMSELQTQAPAAGSTSLECCGQMWLEGIRPRVFARVNKHHQSGAFERMQASHTLNALQKLGHIQHRCAAMWKQSKTRCGGKTLITEHRGWRGSLCKSTPAYTHGILVCRLQMREHEYTAHTLTEYTLQTSLLVFLVERPRTETAGRGNVSPHTVCIVYHKNVFI